MAQHTLFKGKLFLYISIIANKYNYLDSVIATRENVENIIGIIYIELVEVLLARTYGLRSTMDNVQAEALRSGRPIHRSQVLQINKKSNTIFNEHIAELDVCVGVAKLVKVSYTCATNRQLIYSNAGCTARNHTFTLTLSNMLYR